MGFTLKITKDTGGKKLQKLLKNLKSSNKVAQVGFPSGVIHEESGVSVAYIASIHEYGAPGAGIPERPFLKASLIKGRPDQLRLNKVNLKRIVLGELTFEQALGQLGEMGKGQVAEYIANGSFTPLKPATIKRKGDSKPLIDTGQMRQSVTYEIGEGEGA